MRVPGALYLAGSLIAGGVAIATLIMMVKGDAAAYPLGVKGDRLDITAPQVDCSQVVWPYGCDWMNTSPPPKRHARPAQTRQHYRGLGWSS